MKINIDFVYPVGSIYFSVNNVNPSTYFGGTWVSWGSGRVPVGVDAAQNEFAVVEQTGGEKTHKLTIEEMPKHSHPYKYLTNLVNGLLSAFIPSTTVNSGSGTDQNTSGSGTIGLTGGDQPHNNLQPYITCYMWKRTA